LAEGDERENFVGRKRGKQSMNQDEFDRLPLDDRFLILLHKKIMNKNGGAKRRAKNYYTNQYRKTGIIPKPLLLASKGIMEGRKCSGCERSLSEPVKKRFIEMIKASCDPLDKRFIFITQKGRTIKNYHYWLEEEFNLKISLTALRRFAREDKLKIWLNKPDFDEEPDHCFCFKEEPVFGLVQVDGCTFRYFKIRGENDAWLKPQVIEFYDTGSRKMFVLDACFSESSQNSIHSFSRFLLSTPFPHRKIRFRPDNAKGFLNLKRVINELNIKYSVPDGFYLQPDFSRINAPQDKVHLESSHRSLHNFEMRIIKFFEDKIVKTEPGLIFKKGKKEKISVAYLDIDLEQLRESGLLESYRREHNERKHSFSSNGEISEWIPDEKFDAALCKLPLLSFDPDDVKNFIKYGYHKVKATVSNKGIILFNKRTYYVAVGAENFSRHKSTDVYLSDLRDKLLIFEFKEDGVLLGEALCRKPFEKPVHSPVEANPVELMIDWLESKNMTVDRVSLIEVHYRGLTLEIAKSIYEHNLDRYTAYSNKLRQPQQITGKALFNAFILDCQRHLFREQVAHYATHNEVEK